MILPIRDTRPSRYPITASPAIRWTVRLASGCYGSSSSPTPSPRSASIPRIRPSDSPPPEPAWTRSRCPRASLRLSTPMPPWSTSRRPRSTRSSSAHAPRRFRSERCARPSRPAASFPRSITSGAAAASRLSAGDGCARPAVGRTAHPDHPCRGATRPGHHRESLVPERVDDRGPPDDHHSLRARRGDRPAAGAAARGLVVCPNRACWPRPAGANASSMCTWNHPSRGARHERRRGSRSQGFVGSVPRWSEFAAHASPEAARRRMPRSRPDSTGYGSCNQHD